MVYRFGDVARRTVAVASMLALATGYAAGIYRDVTESGRRDRGRETALENSLEQ